MLLLLFADGDLCNEMMMMMKNRSTFKAISK